MDEFETFLVKAEKKAEEYAEWKRADRELVRLITLYHLYNERNVKNFNDRMPKLSNFYSMKPIRYLSEKMSLEQKMKETLEKIENLVAERAARKRADANGSGGSHDSRSIFL